MEWPSDIKEAFLKVPLQPKSGETKESVMKYLLDQTAKHAVWRARGDPQNLPFAYEAPYTPIGHMSVAGLRGKADFMIMGVEWSEAVDKLYAYVRENVERIMATYQAEAAPYPD